MFDRVLIGFLAFGLFGAVVGLCAHEAGSVYLILILLPAALVAAWYVARGLVRPLHEAAAAADRVAGGEHALLVAAGWTREGRDLARQFNAMSARVIQRTDALESEREQLRAVLGGMAEGVIAVGAGQRVLFANAAAGTILGFDPALAVGRPLWELVRLRPIQDLLDRALKAGQPQREPVEIKTPPVRHLTVYVAPLGEADGPGAVLVLDDESELKRLEKVRQEFVANVSHELKTPLAVIQACAEALQDGAVEDVEARGPFLQQIADQATRLHALILDLLSLGRLDSGEEAFEREELSVGELVTACLDRHRPRAEAKNMTLEAVPPAAELTVWADIEAVGQILDNLVDNAVKYAPAGGAVRVRWAAGPDGVTIDVADNGPGIPEVDLPRIFARFYRVDRARSRELGGTGLGLAIVKRLTQAMGGSVSVTSAVGTGTTFTVTLPRPDAHLTAKAAK
jgi:two-component system, OmpR family, phosphate regulon sensor histidine kinase PhoR